MMELNAGSRRVLRVRQVAVKTGLGIATVWRLASKGNFPLPIKVSKGCTGWYEHEIDEWLEAKAAARKRKNSEINHSAYSQTPPGAKRLD